MTGRILDVTINFIMKPFVILFVFFSRKIHYVTGENDGDPYYGVPLGALHYSADSTQAEAYAADEFTVIFHHFTHRPRQLGCTSMIIGPPRPEDRNTVVEEGILLSMSQPLVTSEPARRRLIRQAPLTIFGMRNWPVEFDHLTLRKDDRVPTMSQQKDPLAEIEMDTDSSVETKDIHIDNVTGPEHLNSSTLPAMNNSNLSGTADTTLETTDDLPFSIPNIEVEQLTTPLTDVTSTAENDRSSTVTPEDNIENVETTPNIDSDDNSTNETATAVSKEFTKEQMSDDMKSTKTGSEELGTDVEFESSDIAGTTTHAIEILKKALQAAQDAEERDLGSSEEGKTEQEVIQARGNDDNSGRNADHDVTYEEEKRKTGQDLFKKLSGPDHTAKAEKFNKSNQKGKGYTVILGQAAPERWLKKSPQHVPLDEGSKDDESTKDDYILSDKFFETDEDLVPVSTNSASPSTTPSSQKSTPLFWVIEDPRLKKRRLMELRKKGHLQNQHIKLVKGRTATTTSTTATSPRAHFDRRYELPLVEDKTVAFSVTNDAKITDYKWIGLYDHCAQRSIPLLSLRGVDPPHEEKIGPLLSQSHNVTSYRIQILNCNTILIPGFSFNQGDDPPETYFYIGIGHFPDRIEKNVRAYVIGQPPDQPLRNYNGEDVMIRLPKTYRTFDIDFISVYNEVEERSYGHAIVPSLLVPPCSEHDTV